VEHERKDNVEEFSVYFSANQGIPDTKNSDTTQLKMWRSRLYGIPGIVDSTHAHLVSILRILLNKQRTALGLFFSQGAISNIISSASVLNG
jgi:hypothetical protein